jgi:hypothetical protein
MTVAPVVAAITSGAEHVVEVRMGDEQEIGRLDIGRTETNRRHTWRLVEVRIEEHGQAATTDPKGRAAEPLDRHSRHPPKSAPWGLGRAPEGARRSRASDPANQTPKVQRCVGEPRSVIPCR